MQVFEKIITPTENLDLSRAQKEVCWDNTPCLLTLIRLRKIWKNTFMLLWSDDWHAGLLLCKICCLKGVLGFPKGLFQCPLNYVKTK